MMRIAPNALNLAQQGFGDAAQRLIDAAKRLANEPEPSAMVDLKLAQQQGRAALAIARSEDDMLGTLLDVLE